MLTLCTVRVPYTVTRKVMHPLGRIVFSTCIMLFSRQRGLELYAIAERCIHDVVPKPPFSLCVPNLP